MRRNLGATVCANSYRSVSGTASAAYRMSPGLCTESNSCPAPVAMTPPMALNAKLLPQNESGCSRPAPKPVAKYTAFAGSSPRSRKTPSVLTAPKENTPFPSIAWVRCPRSRPGRSRVASKLAPAAGERRSSTPNIGCSSTLHPVRLCCRIWRPASAWPLTSARNCAIGRGLLKQALAPVALACRLAGPSESSIDQADGDLAFPAATAPNSFDDRACGHIGHMAGKDYEVEVRVRQAFERFVAAACKGALAPYRAQGGSQQPTLDRARLDRQYAIVNRHFKTFAHCDWKNLRDRKVANEL